MSTSQELSGVESPAGGTILAARGVGKQYGAVRALQGVDLEIRGGELIGLVGDNGAGKSTLVKILAGAVDPSEGTLEVDGQRARTGSPDAAREHGVETVYQDLGLCDNLTVAENIFLGREPVRGWGPMRRIDKRRMNREVRAVLATLAVNVPRASAKVSELSGGQRQAVALSRCKLWRRRLILLDEPTAALGVQESQKVVETVQDLRRDGAAIVLISHDIPLVLALSSRVVVLRKGRVVADRPTSELAEHDVVSMITGATTAGVGR